MSEEIDCPVCNQGKLIDFTDKDTGLESSICDCCEVIQCNKAQLVHNKWMRLLKTAVDKDKHNV